MNIWTGTRYKVRIVVESCTLSEDCETIYDNIWHDEKSEEEMIITGHELIGLIVKELQNSEIDSFNTTDKEIQFETYYHLTGEGDTIHYYIEEYTEKDI